MSGSLFDMAPWQDDRPSARMPPIPIKVRWDYTAEIVVDDGVPTLFDTTWTYIFYGPDEALQWGIMKHPGHHQFLVEASVPELIKLAVMVT